MNLQGSINENQNNLYKLYLELAHMFTENGMIRDLWNAMARDVEQQTRSLKALPPSFWRQLKQVPDAPRLATPGTTKEYSLEKEEVISLRFSFALALEAEEPIILKMYVPIIRSLRKNRTSASLDFYIMVKSHLTRIVRVTESFAGDPLLARRANLLLQGLEKEVQEREEELPPPVNRVLAGPLEQKKKPAPGKPQKAAKPPASSKTHAKALRNHPKTLAKKTDLPRRRARR